MKKNKGITLIALIISIIVILILIAVTISLVINSGLIDTAKGTTTRYKESRINEEIRIAWNKVQIESIVPKWNNTTKTSELQAELRRNDDSATTTLDGENIEIVYKGYSTTINVNEGTLAELAQVVVDRDVGIDANGNEVNLDLWAYSFNSDNTVSLINTTGNYLGCCYIPLREGWTSSSLYSPDIPVVNVVCPEYIKKAGEAEFWPVTKIGDKAFMDTATLETVVLPNTITEIGNRAFSYSYLHSITLSNSLTTIKGQAFESCDYLTSIDLPNSLNSIGTNAFAYTKIRRITLPASVTSCAPLENCCEIVYVDSATIYNELITGGNTLGDDIDVISIKQDIYNSGVSTLTSGSEHYIFNAIYGGYARHLRDTDETDFGSIY